MSPAKAVKSVRDALKYVADNPQWPAIPPLDMPVWEIVARNLYDIANSPDTRVVGSMAKATRAQKIILNRSTGTRRAGTHPAQRVNQGITFTDLTKGAIND